MSNETHLHPSRPRLTLITLARKMMLKPDQAIALPIVMDKAALVAQCSRQEMIERTHAIPQVCEYLAHVCRQATK